MLDDSSSAPVNISFHYFRVNETVLYVCIYMYREGEILKLGRLGEGKERGEEGWLREEGKREEERGEG